MSRREYVGIFRDKPDLEILLTNDAIINITGMMGSGKTTLAQQISKTKKMDLISLDWMFGASLKNRPDNIKQLLDSFINEHPEIKNKDKYYEYADLIYEYLYKKLSPPKIFEGRHIYMYMDINTLKGKIIIKRTSLVHSYKRAFKRDMQHKIKEYKNKEINLVQVLNRLFERIKIPIKDYILINKYLNKMSRKMMKKKIKYKHFIITRFNIRANYSCSLKDSSYNPMTKILDLDYLKQRFSIFEKYTLPSIKSQTNQNFSWIVLFHSDTPNIFKSKILKLKKKYNFIDVYLNDNQKFDLLEYCKDNNLISDYFITTRIDNDDMLSKNYVEKVQNYANQNFHKCILSFENGIKYDLTTNKTYDYARKDNHFLSMIGEKNDSILNYNHSKIFDTGIDVEIIKTCKPMWTEIIHESNVHNMVNEEDIERKLKYNSKILVSDYDQTFYVNDEDIERNKKAVAKFRSEGNIFVIATGRSYIDFQKKLDMYNFKYDYIIINHGATILDKDDNVIANFTINNDIINKIKADLQLEKSIKYFCCSKLESRVEFDYGNLTKIHVEYKTKEEAMFINKIINNKYSNYVNSYYVTKNSVEIISNETNKSNAINLLINKLNLLKEDVYTIGDGYSDIEMIKNFNGYAMVNSIEELNQVALKKYRSVSDLINEIL